MKKIILIILLPIFFTIKGLADVKCAVPFNTYEEEEKAPVNVTTMLYMFLGEGTHYWDECDGTEWVKGSNDLPGVTNETWVFVE